MQKLIETIDARLEQIQCGAQNEARTRLVGAVVRELEQLKQFAVEEQERMIKEVTEFFGEDTSVGHTCDCVSCLTRDRVIEIIKGEENE